MPGKFQSQAFVNYKVYLACEWSMQDSRGNAGAARYTVAATPITLHNEAVSLALHAAGFTLLSRRAEGLLWRKPC